MLACEHEGKRRGGGTFLSNMCNVLYKLHVRKFVSFDMLRLTFSSYQCNKGVQLGMRVDIMLRIVGGWSCADATCMCMFDVCLLHVHVNLQLTLCFSHQTDNKIFIDRLLAFKTNINLEDSCGGGSYGFLALIL